MKEPLTSKSLRFQVIVFIAFITISCSEKTPEISFIDPSIGRMGDILTITGSGFGDERNESFITIAGTSPTTSSYLSWSDKEITVRVPEFGEAGLVYVHRGQKKSNAVLFANLLTLPETVSGSQIGNDPEISSIEPFFSTYRLPYHDTGEQFWRFQGNRRRFFCLERGNSGGSPDNYPPRFYRGFSKRTGLRILERKGNPRPHTRRGHKR